MRSSFMERKAGHPLVAVEREAKAAAAVRDARARRVA
jgi:hypothetical protein